MMPGEPENLSSAADEFPRPGPIPVPHPPYRWYHKTGALLLTIFCMAVGLFLIVYPWTDSWAHNYFAAVVPEWHEYWDNLYIRGGVTGLGVVNFYISMAEVLRLRRFSRR